MGLHKFCVQAEENPGASVHVWLFVCYVNNVDTQRFVYFSKSICLLQSAGLRSIPLHPLSARVALTVAIIPPHYTHNISPHISGSPPIQLIGTERGAIIGIEEKLLYKQAAPFTLAFIYLNTDFSLK